MERRLQALEAKVGVEAEPQKDYLPAWLVQEWKEQGACFDEHGRLISLGPDPELTDEQSPVAEDSDRLAQG